MTAFYDAVAERAAHRCEFCRAPEAIFTLRFEVDHVVPTSLGGDDAFDNLALACRACNLWKSNAVMAPDPETGEKVPLFNPRQDVWHELFTIEIAKAVRLVGKTPVGRATVVQLRMNAAAQCDARYWWIRIGLFP